MERQMAPDKSFDPGIFLISLVSKYVLFIISRYENLAFVEFFFLCKETVLDKMKTFSQFHLFN